MSGTDRAARGLRRYPALLSLGGAAVLSTLLPAALTVPLSGPTASAELAPVPGRGDGAGDLADLGEVSTGGLGGGRGSTAAGGEDLIPPGVGSGDSGRGHHPSNRRCVGKPPRQTEDPMSPTCVAFFAGDNGGSTWKGVTREEIRVVVFQDCDNTSGFETEFVDYDDPELRGSTPAALTTYFNTRFQTYNRRVHLYSAKFSCDTPPLSRLQIVDEELDPFYLVNLDLLYARFDTMSPAMAGEAARLRMMASVPYTTRSFAQQHAPFLVSYVSHLDVHVENVVESLCARLAGRPARFAGDVTYHEAKRKFGLYYDQFGDPEHIGGTLIVDGVRRRCSRAAGEIVVGFMGEGDDEDAMHKMRLAGVTTVIVVNNTNFIPLLVADQEKWYPEWYFPSDMAGKSSFRILPLPITRASFGMMGYRRHGRVNEQYHRLAYAEACPGCTETPQNDLLYEELLLLFTGIQAAGPRLDPYNFERGLLALPRRQSRDPFLPSAYFAPGDHSFAKDYAFVWWDPTGRPPGEAGPGCWRLVEDGLRYRAEDWASAPGDEGIQQTDPPQPCQGERP